MMQLADLPDEMLSEVITHLNLQSKKQFSLVNQRMHRVTLPLLFHTLKAEDWGEERIANFLVTVPFEVIRAYSHMHIRFSLAEDHIAGHDKLARINRLQRAILAQAKIKTLHLSVELFMASTSSDATSLEQQYAAHHETFANLLALAPGAVIAFDLRAARGKSETPDSRERNRLSSDKHFRMLQAAGNIISKLAVGEMGLKPPFTAFAALVDSLQAPPSIVFPPSWCEVSFKRARPVDVQVDWASSHLGESLVYANIGQLAEQHGSSLARLAVSVEMCESFAPGARLIHLPCLLSLTIKQGPHATDCGLLDTLVAPFLTRLAITLPESSIWETSQLFLRKFPSLTLVELEVVDHDDESLLKAGKDGRIDRLIQTYRSADCSLEFSIRQLSEYITLDQSTCESLRRVAPYVRKLAIILHEASSSRETGRWHDHITFPRLTSLWIDAEASNYALEDYHCSGKFWRGMLSFLRDNDFPALRELSYSCETPSTASFGELASIIASPAFPDLRSLDTDHTEAAIFAPTAKRASAFDKHCIQHLVDVCKEKGVDCQLKLPII